jgi:hypothetical protein
MTKEFPFDYINDKIHEYRRAILSSKSEIYYELRNSGIDCGSEYAQEIIFNRFITKITTDNKKEIERFGEYFGQVITQRDQVLKRYVRKSIDHIKTWKDNEHLVEANYLQTIAADTKTNTVQTKITPITGYFDEKTIEYVKRNYPDEYIPKFIRPDNSQANFEDIEILSIANVTGLYDIRNANIKKTLKQNSEQKLDLNELEYRIYSRVKRSSRELKKFADWSCGLRNEDDYPFDGIATTIVCKDKTSKKAPDGKELYAFKDFASSISSSVLVTNTNSARENNDPLNRVKKLQNEYSTENFSQILEQLKETTKRIARGKEVTKTIKYQEYTLLKDDIERLKQYIQLKHYIENNNRVETLIMTNNMYQIYTGEDIGHTSFYFANRDRKRFEYLNNPALADTNNDPHITKLPNVNHLVHRIEETFKKAFTQI